MVVRRSEGGGCCRYFSRAKQRLTIGVAAQKRPSSGCLVACRVCVARTSPSVQPPAWTTLYQTQSSKYILGGTPAPCWFNTVVYLIIPDQPTNHWLDQPIEARLHPETNAWSEELMRACVRASQQRTSGSQSGRPHNTSTYYCAYRVRPAICHCHRRSSSVSASARHQHPSRPCPESPLIAKMASRPPQ
jgi:hypothetical protein